LPPVGAVSKNQAAAGYSKVTGTKNQQVGVIACIIHTFSSLADKLLIILLIRKYGCKTPFFVSSCISCKKLICE
jgi:hypothetical protein